MTYPYALRIAPLERGQSIIALLPLMIGSMNSLNLTASARCYISIVNSCIYRLPKHQLSAIQHRIILSCNITPSIPRFILDLRDGDQSNYHL